MSMDIANWCTRIIRWSFALLFILVPLILTSVNYELFEYNKMMITYAITAVIIAAWIVKMIAQKEIRITRTPLDIPIALFFLSQLVSSLFSIDGHVSWFGYYSRFNGGMISIISYVLLYYAFVSNCPAERDPASRESHYLYNLLKLTLATAVIVALYGFFEHFGYSASCLLFTGKFDVACWVQDVQNRVFATLGQPNWMAAYLAALIPLATGFALQSQKSIRRLADKNQKLWIAEFIIWLTVSVLFFAVLLFTKSRSGLVGFAIADGVFLALLFLSSWQSKKIQGLALNHVLPIAMTHIAFAIIIFFVGTNVDVIDKYFTWESWQHRFTTIQTAAKPASATPKTDTLLTTGGTESGKIRTYVWQGAITAWQSSTKTFFIGTGTETFAFAFFQHKPKAHNLTSEWDFLYNKAHNEYLNYLATTGILGLGSYLLFIGIFIVWYIKITMYDVRCTNKNSESSILDSNFLIRNSLFAGWLSILVTNFFGFSVVIIQLFLFLFPAMVFVLNNQGQSSKIYGKHFNISFSVSRFLSLVLFFTLLAVLGFLARLWWADTRYAKGYQYNRFGKLIEAKNFLTEAINLNTTEPVYYDEDSIVLAQLAVASMENQDGTTAALLAKQSLQENDKALSIAPNNVNFWKTRTKIFYAFASFDPEFTKAAIEALQRALALSPNDPKITYNIAILYGKLGDNQKAIDALKKTIDLKPNYRDAYAALVIFYKEIKQPNLARSTIEEYLTKVDPNDKDFQEQLKGM